MRSVIHIAHRSLHRPHYLNSFFVALLLVLCCILSVQAAPGDLDGSFGTGGKVTTAIGSEADAAQGIVVQPDGKIIVVGYSIFGISHIGAPNNDFVLARYDANGALDASFGTGGKVSTPIGVGNDYAYAVALQPDGKIVVAGSSINENGSPGLDFAVARYETNGTLDTSFGTNGTVTTQFDFRPAEARAVAIQIDGKIVVAGYSSTASNNNVFTLVRYQANGAPDTSFGAGGKTLTPIGTVSRVYSLAIQSDGKIVAAGFGFSGQTTAFALARYNPDGLLDTTFGTGGTVVTPIDTQSSTYAVTIQRDGKIVAVGYSKPSGSAFYHSALARYNSNGTLDTSFGTGGIISTPIRSGDDFNLAVVLQPNGKIVTAGYSSDSGSTSDFSLVRYHSNGELDTTFGTGGIVLTPFGSAGDTGYAVALQPDGKIIAAGITFNGSNDDIALARYLGDAPIDSAAPGNIIISELRLSGTAGANDEFIELYNNTGAGIAVSSADGSNGWSLVAADGTVRYTIPFNTLIPARGHYLVANNSANGYSLATHPAGNLTTAIPDGTYTTEIADNTGVVLYRTSNPLNFTPASALDAVGFGATPAPYSEGLPLIPVGTRPSGEDTTSNRRRPLKGVGFNITMSGEYSFVRKVPNANGIPQDTNNNAADFVLVANDAGTYGTQTAQLGSPAPENRSSPIVNNKISISLVDPTISRSASPNFVRNGSGNSGTLVIRRHFTNSTGAAVMRLRFRIYDITTLNTPALSPPQADLRLTDSTDEMVSTTMGMVTVKGTQVEQPPVQSLGGGLNTSVTVSLPAGGLANGAAIDVQFLLNVVQNGRFRFFFTAEAPQ